MLRLFITNLDTGRVVVDNIEDIDKTEENGDEETHPASNYLVIFCSLNTYQEK